MNLGFDLDKVFINYPPFVPHQLIDWLYKRKSKRLLYRMPKKGEQILRVISHAPPLRPIIDGNVKLLHAHRSKKNKHFLISSRFSFLEKRTNALIKKHKFFELFDNMFFNYTDKQPHIFKDQVIRKLKLKRYVDDDFLLLKYLSAKHPKTKFFWLNNKIKRKLSNNLFAIKNFEEIFK